VKTTNLQVKATNVQKIKRRILPNIFSAAFNFLARLSGVAIKPPSEVSFGLVPNPTSFRNYYLVKGYSTQARRLAAA
jgi:hypothetical protein